MWKSYYVQLQTYFGMELGFIYLRGKKKKSQFVMFADICEFNNISPLLR